MEVKTSELKAHATGIGRILASFWNTPQAFPLLQPMESGGSGEILITIFGGNPNPQLPQRTVTTDLGRTERVLGLPIPGPNSPRLWIGLHEAWKRIGKRKAIFKDCGLRLYIGGMDENGRQFLRLEWVAPEITKEGTFVYQGAHAGHPHWHVDRAALVGHDEHLRSLEVLTAPSTERASIELFSSDVDPISPQLVEDLSWLCSVHLPAQSEWMHHNWDGASLPGPHQSSPQALSMLTRWWEGSLRYIFAELARHSVG